MARPTTHRRSVLGYKAYLTCFMFLDSMTSGVSLLYLLYAGHVKPGA